MKKRISTLFLLTGHSGVGKTTVLKQLSTSNPKIPIVTKISTRLQRKTDDFPKEIIITTENVFDLLDRKGFIGPRYAKYGCKYGYLARSCQVNIKEFSIEGIGLNILDRTNAFAVGDLDESYKALKNIQYRIIVILLYAPPKILKQRLEQKELPSSQFKDRLNSISYLNASGLPLIMPYFNYSISTITPIEETIEKIQRILNYELQEDC